MVWVHHPCTAFPVPVGATPCAMQSTHGDMELVDAEEGYQHLWRKALVYLRHLQVQSQEGVQPAPDFVMHADDDSFVRLDLLLPLVARWPRSRHYWGYVWDGTGARATAPIRNPLNKSFMPEHQYALDWYPPFASGCGFALSWDLVEALLALPLPDYRLLDPPFGIHLCGPPDLCVVQPPVTPVHDEQVRPYRPLPTFRPDTLVQHYLRPEEMAPYFHQALAARADRAAAEPASGATPLAPRSREASVVGEGAGAGGPISPTTTDTAATHSGRGAGSPGAPEQLYDTLVSMGLLRR
ncbi:hypothetical protein V8C86DRAFT_2790219 [Haematococcus lacustris]